MNYKIEPRADLRKANLRGTDLRKANLRGTDLRKANLRGTDLRKANLRGTDLRKADLREANLYEVNLYEADLRKADLYEADLYGADLYGAKGVLSIQFDPRGYQLIAYVCNNEIRIMAGCRNFTKAEAIAHWGGEKYPDKNLGRQYVRFIKQIYKKDLLR